MTRPLIAILRGITAPEAADIGRALRDAGISRIEVPMNSPDPLESISVLVETLGQDALIGAGTVLHVPEVDAVHSVGGTLIVSPNCDVEVIARTRALGMESWPGVFTPTEAFAALAAGANGLKLFPASMVGTAGLSAMRAILPPDAQVYAVGGAGADNFSEWIAASADGFGLGSALYKPGFSATEVAKRAKDIVAAFDAVQR